eukprot:7016069-Pyramimonas_sp.AAC.1
MGPLRQGGHTHCCKVLIEEGGASLHLQGEDDTTALHEAARHNHMVYSPSPSAIGTLCGYILSPLSRLVHALGVAFIHKGRTTPCCTLLTESRARFWNGWSQAVVSQLLAVRARQKLPNVDTPTRDICKMQNAYGQTALHIAAEKRVPPLSHDPLTQASPEASLALGDA